MATCKWGDPPWSPCGNPRAKGDADLLSASLPGCSATSRVAVYSYLNMGTCRPFCRIGKSNHLYPGEFRKISVVFTYPSVKGKEELEETEHGVFCRLYFDSMLGINNDYKEMIKKLSEEEINQLVFATMNPAQYRALVFYILIDLIFYTTELSFATGGIRGIMWEGRFREDEPMERWKSNDGSL